MRECTVVWQDRTTIASVVDRQTPVVRVAVRDGGLVSITLATADAVEIPYSTASSMLWALTAAGVRHHMVAEFPP